MTIDSSTIRKHLKKTYQLVDKHPDALLVSGWIRPKLKREKLDATIAKCGLNIPEETRAWMCALDGFCLTWIGADPPLLPEHHTVEAQLIAEQRCRLGGLIGRVNISAWRPLLTDKWFDRKNFAPHHRLLDDFYSYSADDYFHVIHLECDPSREDVLVRFGDDHGADFDSSIPVTLPVYLKLMAITLGTGRDRVLCRGTGASYLVLDDPRRLPDFTPEEVVAMVIDKDEGVRARFDEAIASIHASHPPG